MITAAAAARAARARLDAGTLGVVAVTVDSARQAIGLLRRGHGPELTVLTAGEVTVDADAAQIPVGIDGETVMLPAPVRCTIRPRVLRVVVPRERPGVPAPKAALEWPRLRQLASFRAQPEAGPASVQPGKGPSHEHSSKVAGNRPRTGAPAPPALSRRHRLPPVGHTCDLAQLPLLSRPLARLRAAICCAASVTRRGAVRLRVGFDLRAAGVLVRELVEVRPGDLRRDGGGVIAAAPADLGRPRLPGARARA